MDKVIVLLALFNGEKFLREQIDSIVNQIDCQVELQVGDNGSTDTSLEIIQEYIDRGLITRVIHVAKAGFTPTFFELLSQVQAGSYVAFSDQDDVWHKQKLRIMLTEASLESEPTLVFSRRIYIDANSSMTGGDAIPLVGSSWRNAVIQNIAPGNTIILNPAAVNLLKSLGEPDVEFYDSWVYLVIALVGKVKFINKELVFYRLHGNNAVGLRRNFDFSKGLNSINGYLKQARVVANILESRSDLQVPESFMKFVGRISDSRLLIRLSTVFRDSIFRQNSFETFLFKFGIAWCVLFRSEEYVDRKII